MSVTKLAFNQTNGQAVSVLDFGADHTGATNVVPAIESAVNYAKSQNTGLTTPSGTGSVSSKYINIFFPAGKYLFTEAYNPPADTYIRFIGDGAGYYASEFLQGYDGHIIHGLSGVNQTWRFEDIVFQGSKNVYQAGAWNGIFTEGDCVHAHVKRCVFRDFYGEGAKFGNIFSCIFEGNIYAYNRGGGLYVAGGTGNDFIQETTQVNAGYGIDIGGTGVRLSCWLEQDLSRNNPAGENASFRALKIRCSNSQILCSAIIVDSTNDKTPVEIVGTQNHLQVVASDKGAASKWATFDSAAIYNICTGGMFDLDLIEGDDSAIATTIRHSAGEGPNIRIAYDKANDRGVIQCGEPGVANDDLRITGGTNLNMAFTNIILNGKLCSDQTATGTTAGVLQRKLPICNEAGNILGYIPIYDAIT